MVGCGSPWLGMYGGGGVYGGRDIGVLSMVLTLGWGCVWVRFSDFFFFLLGAIFLGRFFFASRDPLCLRVRGSGAFGFLWEREQMCDNVKMCEGG